MQTFSCLFLGKASACLLFNSLFNISMWAFGKTLAKLVNGIPEEYYFEQPEADRMQ